MRKKALSWLLTAAMMISLFASVPMIAYAADTASGNAAVFDSSSNTYISVPAGDSLDVTNKLTIEAWIKPSAGGGEWALIMGKQWNSDDANPWYSYRLLAASADSGEKGFPRKAAFQIAPEGSGETGVESTTIIQNDVWTHIAGVYDGSSVKIYINGVLENSNPATGNIRTSTLPLYLGKAPWTNNNNYNGMTDEVRIWNVARTAEQISDDMQYVLDGDEVGLVGYWNFNEAPGATTIADASGNNNAGTMRNGADLASSSAPVSINDEPQEATIIVANTNNSRIDFFDIAADGNIAPSRTIAGASTNLNRPVDVSLYNGELYVLNHEVHTIEVFDPREEGNTAPVRRIIGGMSYPSGFDFDAAAGEIFVANYSGNITVYNIADSGTVTPKRTIAKGNTMTLAVSGNELFVTTYTEPVLYVYNKTTGELLRTISGGNTGFSGNLYGVAISGGELFISDYGHNTIRVFNTTDSGDAAPKRIIAGGETLLGTPRGLHIADHKLYVANNNNSVTVFNLADSGNVAPVQLLSGAATTFNAIQKVAVAEITPQEPGLWTDGLTADASYPYGGGSGTAGDPYKISTPEQLAQLSVNVRDITGYSSGKYFKLMADIDLSTKQWTPIGVSWVDNTHFGGVFDGNGHVIAGVNHNDTLSATKTQMVGFFGWLYGATVKNLGIADANITAAAVGGDSWASAFAAYPDQNTLIENCFATGAVSAPGVLGVGGFAAQSYNGANSMIKNCYFIGSASGGSSAKIGGFIGYCRGSVQNSYCSAEVTTSAAGSRGSFAGEMISGGNIANCYYNSDRSGLGGINGSDAASQAEGKTAVQIQGAGFVGTLNAAQSPLPWTTDSRSINGGFPVLAWQIPVTLVRASETKLVDFFPKTTQGENGIYLQSRDEQGNYYNLDHFADYTFKTTGASFNLPLVAIGDKANEIIKADPSALIQVGLERDSVIRTTLNGDFGWVRVTGSAQMDTKGSARFYIYKDDAGYTSPLWEATPGITPVSFDLTIPYAQDDQLFFAADAGADDVSDWAIWKSIRFIAASAPAAPTLQSAVTSADGSKVVLNFDKTMAAPTGEPAEFAVIVNDNLNPVIDMALDPSDAKNIVLTLTTPVVYDDSVTVSYPPGGSIKSSDNGTLATFSDQPVTNNVPANVARIGSIGYPTLADALANAGGSTIRLLANIDYFNAIKADTQNVTIDLNGFDLTVSGVTEHALQATNGRLITITDQDEEGGKISVFSSGPNKYAAYAAAGGDINIEGALSATYPGGLDNQGIIGAYATDAGSTVQVTGSVSGYSEGIHAANSAHITVDGTINGTYYGAYIAYHGSADITGNVSGSRALVVEYAGTAEVDGDITGSSWAVEGTTDFGWDPPMIRVTGDVTGTGGAAISAGNAADIQVTGNVAGYIAVSGSSSGNPDVTVNGDITVSTGFGVSVFYGGTVTVNGRILGASPYLKLNHLDISQDDFEISGNYFKYSNQTAETPAPFAANTVYVTKVNQSPAIASNWNYTTVCFGKNYAYTLTVTDTENTSGTKIYSSLDNAPYTIAWTYPGAPGTQNMTLSPLKGVLAAGSHTLRYYAQDSGGAVSGTLTLTFAVTDEPANTGSGGSTVPDAGPKITVATEDGSVSVTGTLTQTNGGSQVVIKNDAFDKVDIANKPVSVDAQLATVTFDKKAMDTIGAASGAGDVTIAARQVPTSELSDRDRALVGSRPIYDFTVTSGGKTISNFNGGHATISIPYTLTAGENPHAIVIWYLSDSGKLVGMRGHYDASKKAVVFRTPHFSSFVIGYNPISFKDVSAGAWYESAVTFLAARNITTGTGEGNFCPDAALTRGQFVVMLMRAYGIAPDEAPADNFSDAGNTYDTSYLAAAKRLGISAGIGNNLFAPDKEITRQEMFTLLYNALKIIGELPTGTSGMTLSDFSDASSIASWAKNAMALLVETGTVSGSGGKLSPTDRTTRAEIAQVLYNLLSK